MLTSQRKQLLLARLQRDGQIVARALSEELGTSEDTIRRDLRELAAQGRLQRVHGGALPASPAAANLVQRGSVAADDKVLLGRAGAAMVQSGQLVILDGGTTAVQVARHLAPALRATFVTHSPAVALELAQHPHLEILMLGGRLFRHSMVNVGAGVLEGAAHLAADLYFMGATGVQVQQGLTTGDAEEAAVKRVLHQRAADTIVLASTEKLGAASPFVIAPLRQAALLVVPPQTPARQIEAFRAAGVQVSVAAA